jgi:hypothetical protein
MRKGYPAAVSLPAVLLLCFGTDGRPLLRESGRDMRDGAYFPYFTLLSEEPTLSARIAFPGLGDDDGHETFVSAGYRCAVAPAQRPTEPDTDRMGCLYGAAGLRRGPLAAGAYLTDISIDGQKWPDSERGDYGVRCGLWATPAESPLRGLSIDFEGEIVTRGDSVFGTDRQYHSICSESGWAERHQSDLAIAATAVVGPPAGRGALLLGLDAGGERLLDSAKHRLECARRSSSSDDEFRADSVVFARGSSVRRWRAATIGGSAGWVYLRGPGFIGILRGGIRYRRRVADTLVDTVAVSYRAAEGSWEFDRDGSVSLDRRRHDFLSFSAEMIQGRRVMLGPVSLLWGLGALYEVTIIRGPGMPGFTGRLRRYWEERPEALIELAAPAMLEWRPRRLTFYARWTPLWRFRRTRTSPYSHHSHYQEYAATHRGLDLSRTTLGIEFRPSERVTLGLVPAFSGEGFLARLGGRVKW